MALGTAIELIKSYGLAPVADMPDTQQLLNQWVWDKEFHVGSIKKAAVNRTFGALIQKYVLGDDLSGDEELRHVFNHMGKMLRTSGRIRSFEAYKGSGKQNRRIDYAIAQSSRKLTDNRYGTGTAVRFSPVAFQLSQQEKNVRIAVLGYGAAGILVANALLVSGYTNVHIFEKGDSLGIWRQKNVYNRSRNNPANLRFRDAVLPAAPGSGNSVKDFLSAYTTASNRQQREIEKIAPGRNFDHALIFKDSQNTGTYPIVINCMGLGAPKAVHDASRMRCSLDATHAGERWQRELDSVISKRKHFTLVGLGNSTAEMLRQLHQLQDTGVDLDYTVLTHYPEEALQTPQGSGFVGGREYRVFRDISQPNLVSFQGDLPESRYDYFRALRTNRIVGDVKQWTRAQEPRGKIGIRKANGQRQEFATDNLFTLIGYKHTREQYKAFGISLDATHSCAMVDYDGEVQCPREEGQRLFRGYFAFGALIASPDNPNAMVIPGMLFRLPDLLTSVALRVAEVAEKAA